MRIEIKITGPTGCGKSAAIGWFIYLFSNKNQWKITEIPEHGLVIEGGWKNSDNPYV